MTDLHESNNPKYTAQIDTVGWLVGPLSDKQRNVRMGCREFFFLPSPFSQKNFSKKTFPPRLILP